MIDTTCDHKPRIQRFAGMIDDFATWIEEHHAALKSGKVRGPQLPFAPQLSATMGGFLSVGTHYLHGAPNVGKTAFANQIAACCGCPALIVSTEMTGRELFLRQIARTTDTPIRILLGGTCSTHQIVALAKATAAQMPQLCVLDATATPASIEEIQEGVRTLHDDSGHMLLVIDSLHSWSRRHGIGQSEYERITAGTSLFESLASLEKISVLLIAERSRGTMVSGGMHAAKGSSSVEYSARSVWSLDNETEGKSGTSDTLSVGLHVAKCKDGPSDITVRFCFRADRMRFEEVG